MNTRLIAILLCAGAVAFALVPRSQTEAMANHDERTRRKHDGELTSSLDVDARANEVRFAFHVANIGNRKLEVTFPSGQQFDIAVFDSTGREVWRWAQGRMFTQALQARPLSGGDTINIEEKWAAAGAKPLAAGRYVAVATLMSENYPVEKRVEFVLP
jgi:hypothetical protein